jgi:hypothetical protein
VNRRGGKGIPSTTFRPRYENKSVNEAIEQLRKDFASLEEIVRKEVGSAEEARALLKRAGGDVKGLLKMIDGAARLEDELARISALPRAEFNSALSAFQKRYPEPNPFVLEIDRLQGHA